MKAEGIKTVGVRKIKKQERSISVGKPILIWAHSHRFIWYSSYILYKNNPHPLSSDAD